MKITLFDYQSKATTAALKNLTKARKEWEDRDDPTPSWFALSAVTGAGKTVMAADIIESILFGSDDNDFDADPNAVVLWLSDDPSLNAQTADQFRRVSTELSGNITIISSHFYEKSLEAGHVYFLNTQKLGAKSTLSKGKKMSADGLFVEHLGNEADQSSFVQIMQQTHDDGKTVYLIIDEAHRGMNPNNKRTTIVNNLINLHRDDVLGGDLRSGGDYLAPIVVGISATKDRFTKTMESAGYRTHRADVNIEPSDVQASGLLKETISLSTPEGKGNFSDTLIDFSTKRFVKVRDRWHDYCAEQGVEKVEPLMVFQVPDKVSDSDLAGYIKEMTDAAPEGTFGPHSIAHTFGAHTDIVLGDRTIPYVEPQKIQDDTDVIVVLAKTAISTGWNCPRAEVLLSLRPGVDITSIIQIIGRMVRNPLARRIEDDELLNSVYCCLPLFDAATAAKAAKIILRGGDEGDEMEGRKVLIDTVEARLNTSLDQVDTIRGALETIVSYAPSERSKRPIPAALALAVLIDEDSDVLSLRDHAGIEIQTGAHKYVKSRILTFIDRAIEDNQSAVDTKITDILTLGASETVVDLGSGDTTVNSFTTPAFASDSGMRDAERIARRILDPAVIKAYITRATDKVGGDEYEETIASENASQKIYAAADTPAVMSQVESDVSALVDKMIADAKRNLNSLKSSRKPDYEPYLTSGSEPISREMILPDVRQVATKDRKGDPIPLAPHADKHLLTYVDEVTGENKYFDTINDLEHKVIDAEFENKNCLAWYRNPRSQDASALSIPYTLGDQSKMLHPDFIMFYLDQDENIKPGIIDPHSDHLGDSLGKLKGLVAYAESHGETFNRIHSITEIKENVNGNTKSTIYTLDLLDPEVRKEIDEHSGHVADLYKSVGTAR